MSRGDVVWKLLRCNINLWQLGGYAVSTLVGLCTVLCALQFYRDIHSGSDEEDAYMLRDYVVISHKVGALDVLGQGNSFSVGDIEEIKSQPWAVRVGTFTAADFNVSARVDLGSRPLTTALFLESVPDDFFDISPAGWRFTPGEDAIVPIVLNKDYLTLYNYGFAASAGLPQISEGLIGMLPLRLSLSGNGKQQWIRGRIVGFSSRLNTIAVPESFMDWANSEFGEGNVNAPSRLIVETKSSGSPVMNDWLARKGYETGGDSSAAGKASFIMSVASGVVGGIGVVICALALGILLLSIWLLLEKNRDKIHGLLLQGYTPSNVSRRYYLLVGSLNAVVLMISVVVLLSVSPLWEEALESGGVNGAGKGVTVVAGAVIMGAVSAINFVAISRKVRGAYFG